MTGERHIVHFDLDTFYVSVERLKNPALGGKPILIGGTGDRAVVASCSYEARRFGVHSAMPMKLARRLCPEALVIRGDMESYSRYSRLVTDVIADTVPLYEKSSIDEFYIDLTGMDRFYQVNSFSEALRDRICKESGLPVSFALASNKLVSKVATNEAKPRGQLMVPFGHEKEFLSPLRITKIPGVGKETAYLLFRMGVETIKVLSEIPVEMLANLLGKPGIELSRKANGLDESPVVPFSEQKSISKEQTFEKDTIDVGFLESQLVSMTESLGYQLRAQNKLAGCVTVKLRYTNFDTATRQRSIAYTSMDDILIKTTRELFKGLFDRRLLIRLLGVKVNHLVPGNHQIHLFDDTEERIRLYQAVDSVKAQYGEQYLRRGRSIR